MSRLRTVAERYATFASVYRRHWAPLMMALSKPGLRALPVRAGERVLDLGCGVGAVSAPLARRRARITGVDLSDEMLAHARGLDRVLGDLEHLPFAGGSFDAVLCTFVLQHLPRPARVFAEAARVLRPGGSIVTVTWGRDAEETGGPYEVMALALDRAGAASDPAIRTWHHRYDSPAKIRRVVQRVGMGVVRAWSEYVEWRWTAESFIGWATSMGFFCRRLAKLDARTRARVIEQARARICKLPAEEMTWRPEIVFLLAERPLARTKP